MLLMGVTSTLHTLGQELFSPDWHVSPVTLKFYFTDI